MLYYDLTLYSFHHSVVYIFYHPKWYFHTIFPLRNLHPHNLYHLVILVISLSVLLLLCRFSHVWLPATPLTAAHQAPPFMGFSRQEHWTGCHFLLGVSEAGCGYREQENSSLEWPGLTAPLLRAALFIIAKKWKQPKCPSRDEWDKENVHTHIREEWWH